MTQAWVDALNAAVEKSSAEGRLALPSDVSICIGHVVREAPDGEVHYLLRVSGGQVRAELGEVAPADVVLYEDYATAAALARGTLSAQQAVSEGRLKLAGNVALLVRQGPALSPLAAVLSDLQRTTTYDLEL